MKVAVSSQNSSLDEATHDDLCDRLHFALSRFSPHIERVTAQIGEVAGTRGSLQQLCRLSIRMKRLGSFSIESVEERTRDAVARAVDRAAKQVRRILDRQ